MDFTHLIYLLAILLGAGGESQMPGDSDEDVVGDTCMARLVNHCFRDVMPTITQRIMFNQGTVSDICNVSEDALRCASDIIDDSSCRALEGRLNFDDWMSGLTAVKQELCGPDRTILNVFTSDVCFSSEDFFECVEARIEVNHVVDLLRVLNNEKCIQIVMALVTCNVRTSPPHSTCYISQDIVNHVVQTFFANTQCGNMNKTCVPQNSVTTTSEPLLPQTPTRSAKTRLSPNLFSTKAESLITRSNLFTTSMPLRRSLASPTRSGPLLTVLFPAFLYLRSICS